MRPSLLNTGAPASSAATSADAWASASASRRWRSLHRHLSPADVDARLEQIVRRRVEERRHLELTDAEDAHDAHVTTSGKNPSPSSARGRGEPHASNS